jgi:GT2 family glycosyltransferase
MVILRTAQFRNDDPLDGPSLLISVVIPTYNRWDRLLDCLEALSVDFSAESSENFLSEAEVIVVSDGGDREHMPDLGRFEASLALRVIHAEHAGPGAARNQGLAAARGRLVAFTDDDCLPQPGWLRAFVDASMRHPDAGLGGRTVNGLPDNVYSEAAQMVLDLVEMDQVRRNYPAFFFASNNIAFPTGKLHALGGFDPDYRTSEDRELCRRWRRQGWELVKVEGARVAHAPMLDFRSFWAKISHYGEGAARFHKDPSEGWRKTLAWHLRMPALAWLYLRTNRPRRPLALIGLLMLWEVANLHGFVKGALR